MSTKSCCQLERYRIQFSAPKPAMSMFIPHRLAIPAKRSTSLNTDKH